MLASVTVMGWALVLERGLVWVLVGALELVQVAEVLGLVAEVAEVAEVAQVGLELHQGGKEAQHRLCYLAGNNHHWLGNNNFRRHMAIALGTHLMIRAVCQGVPSPKHRSATPKNKQ